MHIKLKILTGKHAGQDVEVRKRKFLIGRGEECHLRPNSDLVSRHHCVLVVEADHVQVHDLGSRNGTQINGATVKRGARRVASGDRVQVGPLEFAIVYSVSAAVAEELPAGQLPANLATTAELPPQPKVGAADSKTERKLAASAAANESGQGANPASTAEPDSKVLEWLTDAPALPRRPLVWQPPVEPAKNAGDTGQMSLDNTGALFREVLIVPPYPGEEAADAGAPAQTLAESKELTDSKATSSREAASNFIEMFRKKRPQ